MLFYDYCMTVASTAIDFYMEESKKTLKTMKLEGT
jgi:hypothetical protein